MQVEIVATFIPIIFFIGLFTAISLNIYYKYKTNIIMSERVPLESLGEWYKANALARALRSRGAGLRWGGFFTGLGLGVAIGCAIVVHPDFAAHTSLDKYATATFLVIALAVFCGGVGMIGAYFLERRLDRGLDLKSK